MDLSLAERCARLALAGIRREYPNQMALVLTSAGDARTPRELTPAFYGCYDWHSAVHAHWCLVRLLRECPEIESADAIRTALGESLTPENIDAETRYVGDANRTGFERPYGLAWLLQLAAELREANFTEAGGWLRNLQPLEELAVDRLSRWLPRLPWPIRSGEHSQTAFAMGLAWDYARIADNLGFQQLLEERALHFHLFDRDAPLSYEPSGHDFVSPCLAEADLLRRLLNAGAFGSWLQRFLPGIPHDATDDWLNPATVGDANDGKLVHLDGLNLSRAWMLDGIASALPADDPRIPALRSAAAQHQDAGLRALDKEDYVLTHWIGSFAVYLLTGRGIPLQA